MIGQAIFFAAVFITIAFLMVAASKKKKEINQNNRHPSMGKNRRIVNYADRWVTVDIFPLTKDLKGDLSTLLTNIQDKKFYYEDIHIQYQSGNKAIKRGHGPYFVNDINAEFYSLVDEKKFWLEFARIIHDPKFNIGFSQEFIVECKELIEPLLKKNEDIIWLEIPKDKPIEIWGRYGYWEEFWIRDFDNDELILIVFGDD